jgi:hypothetical protein
MDIGQPFSAIEIPLLYKEISVLCTLNFCPGKAPPESYFLEISPD